MPTAEQEAWIINFQNDIKKIYKDLLNELNKNCPRDAQFRFNEQFRYLVRWITTSKDSGHQERIELNPIFTPNGKIKWQIEYEISIKKIDRGLIPVSHNDFYTKKELERAYKSILLKVIEDINNSF